jgi:hypothetical protein
MALTAALKAAHATVDNAVASHAAAEALVNNFRNTIAGLPLATSSSDAQPTTTADRAALDTNLYLVQRVASATKTQLDSARALLSMIIDASTSSAPPVPDGTSTPSSTASTAAATVPADSATLAFDLARAEANTQAKQSTETLPLVINVPPVLEHDMSHNSQWRSWFHNQAVLCDCVSALTHEPPAPYPPDALRRPRGTSTKGCHPTTQSTWWASEIIPIIGDGSAPATVPPANVQKPHASSIKDLHNPGVLAAAALTFSRNHRRTYLTKPIGRVKFLKAFKLLQHRD